MDDWSKQLEETLDTMAGNLEQFFLELTDEAESWAHSVMDFSEAIASQIEGYIPPDFDQQVNEFLEPVLVGLTELEAAIEQTVEAASQPLTYTINPILNHHASCVGCRHYHGQIYGDQMLVCGMHPYGWDADTCPDWQSSWTDPY